MPHSRYFFTKDYDLDTLPDVLRITQPGVRYDMKQSNDLLQYAPQEYKLPKQNFFKKLQYWYDHGNVPKSSLSGFGELGSERMYVDLFATKPWPNIVGAPKIANIISDEDIMQRRKRLQQERAYADHFANRPYQYRHQPFARTISHDVERLPEEKIIEHARRYDQQTDLSKSPYLPQSVNKRYIPVTGHFPLRLPLLTYGWND